MVSKLSLQLLKISIAVAAMLAGLQPTPAQPEPAPISIVVESELDAQKMACTAAQDFRRDTSNLVIDLRERARGQALREFCADDAELLVTAGNPAEPQQICDTPRVSGVPIAQQAQGTFVWLYWKRSPQIAESVVPFLQRTVWRAPNYARFTDLRELDVLSLRRVLRPSNDDMGAQLAYRALGRYGKDTLLPIKIEGDLSSPTPTVKLGESSTLTWRTSGAAVVTIDNGVLSSTCGTSTVSGSTPIDLRATTDYTLRAWGLGRPSQASQRLSLAELPVGTLIPDPAEILPGGTFVLRWEGKNATSAMIEGGAVSPPEGGTTEPMTAAETKTYHLTLEGPGGSATTEATVTVLPPQISPPPPAAPSLVGTLSGAFDPASGNATLSWRSTSAVSGSINPLVGDLGDDLASGSREVPLNETTDFTLTLTGADGTIFTRTKRVEVPVTKAPPAFPYWIIVVIAAAGIAAWYFVPARRPPAAPRKPEQDQKNQKQTPDLRVHLSEATPEPVFTREDVAGPAFELGYRFHADQPPSFTIDPNDPNDLNDTGPRS